VANVTVKHAPANAAQLGNLKQLCQIAKQMGANAEQTAGAMATMIQESGAVNLQGGDRDSVGLFQQRPSCGWGTYAQCSTPDYAIRKFLTPYLAACKKTSDVIAASNTVQRSAYPEAPRQWLAESRANVQVIMGSKDFGDVTSSGGSSSTITSTRTKPYEFSRGNSGQRETSWDCIGRLADEVAWDRFMRAGALWFVSENWLEAQTPRFAMREGARGVLAIAFDADARRDAQQMSVTAVANRWSVLPGDVVIVSGQGIGNGLWLVSDTHRTLWNPSTEITLKRPTQKKTEPANETETSTKTVTVGGMAVAQAGGTAGPAQAQKLYAAAKAISDRHYPYVWGGGHGAAGTPSGGGFDCSGSVCAALAAAGLGYRLGGPVDVSGTMANSWGQLGVGKWFTVYASPEHVWIRFTGAGPAWRFDTSPHACGSDGPQLRFCPRSYAGFVPRRWPGL
jgi:hypothetical protein